MKAKRIVSLVGLGLILSTGEIMASNIRELPIKVSGVLAKHNIHPEIIKKSGTALKKLENYENAFLVYDINEWNGEEIPVSKADHVIIPIQTYCSPNHEEYFAVKIGDMQIKDEFGNTIVLPLYEEVNMGTTINSMKSRQY